MKTKICILNTRRFNVAVTFKGLIETPFLMVPLFKPF